MCGLECVLLVDSIPKARFMIEFPPQRKSFRSSGLCICNYINLLTYTKAERRMEWWNDRKIAIPLAYWASSSMRQTTGQINNNAPFTGRCCGSILQDQQHSAANLSWESSKATGNTGRGWEPAINQSMSTISLLSNLNFSITRKQRM